MTVELQHAQIRIPLEKDGGPDQVTVWVTGADGSPYDFQVDVPRGQARAYLKGLGFATALEIKTAEVEDPKNPKRKIRREEQGEVAL